MSQGAIKLDERLLIFFLADGCEPAALCTSLRLRSGDQKNFIAFLKSIFGTTEEADVFFVHVDVKKARVSLSSRRCGFEFGNFSSRTESSPKFKLHTR